MIFRLSHKLAKKLKVPSLKPAAADPDPLADWSSHLITADRTQYLILTNTPSLYSTVIFGKGISNDSQFLDRPLGSIREFMVDNGQEFIFRKCVAPASGTVRFASALNRSEAGSMNDFVHAAQIWLTDTDLSPFDVGSKLNDMPMSYLKYRKPREVFKAIGDIHPATGDM